MKRILNYILLIFLVGCYSDDSQTLQSENSTNRTSEITGFIKSISAHDASFDDAIDNTSCFSLIFPYQIRVNTEVKTINSKSDISELNSNDDVEIIYPVNSVFYNYEKHQIDTNTDFKLINTTCKQNLNFQINSCLDIQYPIIFKEFNDLTRRFETFHLDNDEEVFIHLENLHDNDIFEIEYPVFLTNSNSDTLRIDSNAEFISLFDSSIQDCK